MTTRRHDGSRGISGDGTVVAPAVLADFPEITRHEQRCRLCRLVVTHPAELRTLHAEWARGLGAKVIWKQHASALQAATGGAKYSDDSFIRHFQRHVAGAQTDLVRAAATPATEAPAAPVEMLVPVPPAPAPGMTLTALQREVAALPTPDKAAAADFDYHELMRLYLRIRPLMEQILDDTMALLQPDPQTGKTPGVKAYDVVMLKTLYEQVRGTLADLNRIRNSDRLVKHIIADQARTMALRTGEAVVPPLRQIEEALVRGDSLSALSHIRAMTAGDAFVELMSTAARKSLEHTYAQYRLN